LKAEQSFGKRQWVRTVVTAVTENFKTSDVIVTFFDGAVNQTVGERERDVTLNTVMLREGLHNKIINMDNNEHRNSQT
jgi:hypothetical protein